MLAGSLNTGWETAGPRLWALLAAAQLRAARNAQGYVPALLAQTGQKAPASAAIVPAAFAGIASDGRRLDTLLYQPVLESQHQLDSGASATAALTAGRGLLDAIVQTQVADAGRLATGVDAAVRPALTTYVRMPKAPCCKRCAVLAGKVSHWGTAFLRHPHCHCVNIPSTEDRADDFRTDPRQLAEAGGIRDLTAAERKALDDGADIGQVINANRGMYSTVIFRHHIKATLEGTTVRGIAGKRLAAAGAYLPRMGKYETPLTIPRFTPEQIYIDAAGNRAEAVRLLRRFGYIL